jgi:urease accessory protein
MIEIRSKIDGGGNAHVTGRIELSFELRQKRWLNARLVSGEEVLLRLPRGVVLRGGDLLAAPDGRVIEVIAAPERLVHVESASPAELARVAYHLGNRHVPVEVGEEFLRLIEDPIIEDMLRGLGTKITHVEAPFDPEAGAYHSGHANPAHGDSEPSRIGTIHEYSTAAHANDEEQRLK